MNKAIILALWAIMITFWAGIIPATLVPKAYAAEEKPKLQSKVCPLPDYMKLSPDGNKCIVELKAEDKDSTVKRKRFLFTEILEFTTPTPTPTAKPQIVYYKEYAPITVENPASPSATLNPDILFEIVNNYRASVGKPGFIKDAPVCSIAESRRPELYNEIHVTGVLHAGFYAKNHPYWATENMIYERTEARAFNWWMNSPIHRSAIEGNHTHACVACEGNICVQIFTSYTPKYVPPVAIATPIPSQAGTAPGQGDVLETPPVHLVKNAQ